MSPFKHCFFRSFLILVALFQSPSPSFAGNIWHHKIWSYAEIPVLIKNIINGASSGFQYAARDILFLSDWDEVITKRNEILELREGPITAQSIQEIIKLRVQFRVLTSRSQITSNENIIEKMGRLSDSAHRLNGTLDKAHDDLEFSLRVIAFNEDQLIPGPTFDLPNNESLMVSFYAFQGIVFAGNPFYSANGVSFKGIAAAKLIDQKLVRQPKLVIFVDNDKRHLKALEDAFQERDENLILIHFPELPPSAPPSPVRPAQPSRQNSGPGFRNIRMRIIGRSLHGTANPAASSAASSAETPTQSAENLPPSTEKKRSQTDLELPKFKKPFQPSDLPNHESDDLTD